MQYIEKQQQQLEEQNQMYAEQQQQVVAQQEMIERHHELTARVRGMMEILTPGVQALMQKQVEAQEEKKCCHREEMWKPIVLSCVSFSVFCICVQCCKRRIALVYGNG